MTLLSMIRGDRREFAITLTDDDTGDALDLTTMTLVFTAKRRPTDTDAQAIIAKTEGAGITIDADPTTGLATLEIEPEDTEDLDDLRTLYWDLQVDNGAGDVRTPLSGRLALSADVTRTSGAS
jgi:hypothetical protein